MRGSGISRAICKSAPSSRQITMPAPHHWLLIMRKTERTQSTTNNRKLSPINNTIKHTFTSRSWKNNQIHTAVILLLLALFMLFALDPGNTSPSRLLHIYTNTYKNTQTDSPTIMFNGLDDVGLSAAFGHVITTPKPCTFR